MTAITPHCAPTPIRHRPKTLTVFAAAFIAGAVVAVGVNRALDVHLAQSKPQVECEPIFVALRGLPQGSPVTVWDVALRDWPKAMVPSTALKSHDSFEGQLLRHPLREGQPLLSVQLMRAAAASPTSTSDPTVIEQPYAPPPPATATKDVADAGDSWLPGPATPAVAATERPARIAASPQPEIVQPTTSPAAETRSETARSETAPVEPAAVDAPQPVEPDAATPAVAAAAPQPQVLSAVEPQQIIPQPQPQPISQPQPQPQPGSRTDVPDTVAAATPPSPELVPYPAVPTPPPPTAQPPVTAPVTAAVTTPTPAADPTVPAEPTPAGAPTPPASTPSPVEPPADAVTSPQPTPELKTVLAQNPTAAPPADAPAPQQAGESPNRYLVVPERIALQADVSFVNPQPLDSVSDEPTTQVPPSTQPATQPTRQTRQQQPQASTQKQSTPTGRLQGRSGPAVRSPAAPRASGGMPRQQPGPSQPSTGKRPATAAAAPATMFPNIAAGIDALTGGFKRTREEQRTSPPR